MRLWGGRRTHGMKFHKIASPSAQASCFRSQSHICMYVLDHIPIHHTCASHHCHKRRSHSFSSNVFEVERVDHCWSRQQKSLTVTSKKMWACGSQRRRLSFILHFLHRPTSTQRTYSTDTHSTKKHTRNHMIHFLMQESITFSFLLVSSI